MSDADLDEPWLAALRAASAAYAPSTVEVTVRSFRFFQIWCRLAGHAALPAEGASVAGFVDTYAMIFTPRSMMVYLHAIRRVHLVMGLPTPTRAELVRLARLRQSRTAWQPKRRFEVTDEVRARLLQACPATLIGLRDRLLIGMGFDTLCRRAELTAFRLEDLTRLEDGTAELTLVGDANRPSTSAFLSAETVQMLDDWLTATGLVSGPILRGLRLGQMRDAALTPGAVNARLRAVARAAGYDEAAVRQFTSHALRVGAAQSLGRSGRTLMQIMRAGRWKTADVPAAYLRDGGDGIWLGSDGDFYPMNQGSQRWRPGLCGK